MNTNEFPLRGTRWVDCSREDIPSMKTITVAKDDAGLEPIIKFKREPPNSPHV
jgi:hypothetical protein